MTRKTETKESSHAKARQEQAAIGLEGIERLRRSALDLEHEYAAELDGLAPELRRSGVNLLHYLAVRHHDIRELLKLKLTPFHGHLIVLAEGVRSEQTAYPQAALSGAIS